GFSLRTREERFPELWDRSPELALPLFTTAKLPWQTWETACKILRGTQTPLPSLNDRMLAQFLATPSPLLGAVAGRQIMATLAAGRSIAADVAADAYLGGTRRRRAAIERHLTQQENDAKWSRAFATRLFQISSDSVTGPQLSRKAALSFALLISRFPTLFSHDLKSQTVVALYNTARPDFVAWALEAFRNLLPGQLPEWLMAIEALPTESREAAVQAIVAGMASKDVLPRAIEELVRHANAWVRQIGWRVLAHSQTSLAPISSAWSSLLNSNEPIPALLTALESPDALALFSRCNFDSLHMAALLEAHPFLIPLLPMSALEKVVAVLPPNAVLHLVAEATEQQWAELQIAILLGPLLPQNRAVFWQEVFAAIGATGNANLIQRLLNDPKLQAVFLQLTDISEYLKSANPVFGPLLGQWIAAHTDLLRRDSPELLQIATHPLPQIRAVGMNRVREVGMSLPFALRLLESELPPSVGLGKTFFEQMDAGDSQRTEAITALCDSPKPSVRAYGREFLTARPEMLTDTDVLERLSENPDPATQAFVAGKLLTQAATPDQTVAFDRTVMRARDKGRRAKELVKTRLDAQPTPDIALLLEMARSRTPRDADWALSQLAKLALDGVEIPGFTLDGVAGG
ncbi:MAG: protein with signal peptide, partial [Chthonomonadales bacterium]|nr:protein with signal peptide [Chthonomonadales bacterium]